MTEPLPVPGATAPEPAPPRTAGALLRAAREREGLHLAVLAATIKVSPAKLDALEKDRYDELPNATFARALAQSVCRSLKVDPRPVLALLPQQDNVPLDAAVGKLNTPFNEKPSRSEGSGLAWASKPMFVAGALLLVAAAALALLPRDWIEGRRLPFGNAGAPAAPASTATVVLPLPPAASAALGSASDAPAAMADAASAPPVVEAASAAPAAPSAPQIPPVSDKVAVAVVPVLPTAASAPPAAAQSRGGALLLTASAASWIEVLDGEGQSLLSRIVQPGETVSLDGRRPLRVRVGNAGGTQLTYRGAPLDLAPYTRDNVARLELR